MNMKHTSVAALTVGALGIVYGDIGTSPLYAMNEVFFGSGRLAPTPEHAAGVASLIFWLLVLIIGIKYALFVLRRIRVVMRRYEPVGGAARARLLPTWCACVCVLRLGTATIVCPV